MRKQDLAAWLCGPDAPRLSPEEIAAGLGLPAHADAPAPHSMRFLLAVLRDAFDRDGDVVRWMYEPRAALGGARPIELLLAGRVEEVEELAISDWHQPAARAGAIVAPSTAAGAATLRSSVVRHRWPRIGRRRGTRRGVRRPRAGRAR